MKFHLICEGPQDQKILERIISIVLEQIPEFIEPSNTQTKNRGVNSILNNKKRFFQFLHYSFQFRADYIIICVDNDEAEIIDNIPDRYRKLSSEYCEFFQKYNQSYLHNPVEFIVIPIETIDYWILAGKMKNSGCGTLMGIESIPKQGIKERTYGRENLNPIGLVFPDPFESILSETITKETVKETLPKLRSFLPFYEKLQQIKKVAS